MPDYEVKVWFDEDPAGNWEVRADPYPAPGNEVSMKKGDTMTWTLVDGQGAEMQVGFSGVFPLPLEAGKKPEPVPIGSMGPFAGISRDELTVKGTIAHDDNPKRTWRYVCVIFRNGLPLPWKGGIDMGGVDTHTPPPR